tara:strand:+ start:279 stop:425 length:147 start_codon:yes stop_codon:yes gene_type:complete
MQPGYFVELKESIFLDVGEESLLKAVVNRCSKIELLRPFWKPRLHLGM